MLLSTMVLLTAMSIRDSGLHPLSTPLPEGELRITLRNVGPAGQPLAVECTYRAHRERDVRKNRTLHLLDSPWRSGSRDPVNTQRDETQSMTLVVDVTAAGASFTVPLHPSDAPFRAYGLASVRIGGIEFDRWFPESPTLDSGFGLRCSPATLQGTVRLEGLGAPPLSGGLPLWPSLREISLDISPVTRPRLELWDPLTKHYWDGWRVSTPQDWPGGRTFTARHVASPTVWQAHEYFALPPGGVSTPAAGPRPPTRTNGGVTLEVFWPNGDRLDFPDVRFESEAEVFAIPIGRMTAGAWTILKSSATPRAGLEMLSVSRAEWAQLDALVSEEIASPIEWELITADDEPLLVAHRQALSEPWLFVFGIEYDGGRRYAIATLVIHPTLWDGPLPTDLP